MPVQKTDRPKKPERSEIPKATPAQLDELLRHAASLQRMQRGPQGNPDRKKKLDEQARIGAAQAYALPEGTCEKCGGRGYLTEQIRDLYSMIGWKLAGISAGEIEWCDCQAGQQAKSDYESFVGHREQVRVDDLFEGAGIPLKFRGLTLNGIPPRYREGKDRAIELAVHYIRHGYVLNRQGKKREGIFLLGEPGVGKTGILSVVFSKKIEEGIAGLWLEAKEFFLEVQGEYGKSDNQADAKIKAAMKVPLLLLDDVGDMDRTEKSNGGRVIAPETNNKRDILWAVINHRHANGKPMLITSNLDRSGFDTQWGPKMSTRLWECCVIAHVGGVNLREVDFP